MNLNFVFTGGEYNGSSLCILGRNPIDSKNRELSVVGGTSVFRMESGFSISNTYSYDPVENYGVLEYIPWYNLRFVRFGVLQTLVGVGLGKMSNGAVGVGLGKMNSGAVELIWGR
ncbi:hypothetical protein ACS0TY_023041 [Phlomoides rotata]